MPEIPAEGWLGDSGYRVWNLDELPVHRDALAKAEFWIRSGLVYRKFRVLVVRVREPSDASIRLDHREVGESVVAANAAIYKAVLAIAEGAEYHLFAYAGVENAVRPAGGHDDMLAHFCDDGDAATGVILCEFLGKDDGRSVPDFKELWRRPPTLRSDRMNVAPASDGFASERTGYVADRRDQQHPLPEDCHVFGSPDVRVHNAAGRPNARIPSWVRSVL